METTDYRPPQMSQPFRFMYLPVELRLMVYERIPRTVKHTYIRDVSDARHDRNDFKLILITRHVPTSILATCREVQAEANSIIQKLVRSFILEHVPKVVEYGASNEVLADLMGVVSAVYHASRVGKIRSVASRQLAEEHGFRTRHPLHTPPLPMHAPKSASVSSVQSTTNQSISLYNRLP
jgi:hypothetical protein